MKHITTIAFFIALLLPFSSYAVTIEEDIATMLILKGFDCGGKTVQKINSDITDDNGTRLVNATCPNGNVLIFLYQKKAKYRSKCKDSKGQLMLNCFKYLTFQPKNYRNCLPKLNF